MNPLAKQNNHTNIQACRLVFSSLGTKFALLLLLFFLGFSINAFSQKEVRQGLRNGNRQYNQQKYTEAEIDYRKALEANARSTDAAFNLGNALYKQAKAPEAIEQYQASLSEETDKTKIASSWHNIGNIFMATKDYAKSIEAYKQALRSNPADNETRYNLALAQKLLEKQENGGQDQQQEQNQDQQQDQDQNQDQQPSEQQEQQQNPNEMSKENAEQILDAMMQNERDTQEKVKEQQMRQQRQRKTDKNW